MPTDAFLNLDRKKKKKLLDSAIREFSALPYEKVSVFKIAQNAGVSRSGFYYYFNDKEDIYYYILSQLKVEFIRTLDSEEISKWDLFTFCKKAFRYLAGFKGTEKEAFLRQVLFNATPDDARRLLSIMESCISEKSFQYLCKLEDLKISSAFQLMGLTFLVSCSTLYVLQRYFSIEETLEDAERKLEQMLHMLQHGVCSVTAMNMTEEGIN